MKIGLPTPSFEVLVYAPNALQWLKDAYEASIIKIGLVGQAVMALPGFIDSIEMSSELLEESVEQKGTSGSIKVISGWKDCDLSINLLLIDVEKREGNMLVPYMTRYDSLNELVAYFKHMENGAPCIYTAQHPHIKAWSATQFLFNKLKSSETRTKSIINCSLEFDEYDSATKKSQDRQVGVKQETQAQANTAGSPAVADDKRAGLGKLEVQYAKR